MPSRPCKSLGLRLRDPPGAVGHYFLSNNALAGILILMFNLQRRNIKRQKGGRRLCHVVDGVWPRSTIVNTWQVGGVTSHGDGGGEYYVLSILVFGLAKLESLV